MIDLTSYRRHNRAEWWACLTLLAALVALPFFADKANAQTGACETYVLDDPGFYAFSDFAYIELGYSDGTSDAFSGVVEGTYFPAPAGETVVSLTKCDVTPATPTPTQEPEPSPSPIPTPTSVPSPTPSPEPEPSPTATPPTPEPSPTSTPEPSPTPPSPTTPTPSATPETPPEPSPTPTEPPSTTTPTPPSSETPSPTPVEDAPPAPPELAVTGNDSGRLVVAAMGTIGVGAFVLAAARATRKDAER